MTAVRRSIVWVDSQGRTRQTIPRCDPDAAGVMAALLNHSQGTVLEWWEGASTFPGTVPAGGVFADVSNLARLTFSTAGGNLVTLSLPSPSAAIFLADGATVDASTIGDIITAAKAALVDAGGNLVTSFIAGIRNTRDESG